MCCEPSGYNERDINGECKECGSPTCDGDAYEQCAYSMVVCNTCGYAPCDDSC